MNDQQAQQPPEGAQRVARLSFLTSLSLFAARLKAYLGMVDDLKATRANIERAEKAAAEIRAVKSSTPSAPSRS
jgi:hypothetical protein